MLRGLEVSSAKFLPNVKFCTFLTAPSSIENWCLFCMHTQAMTHRSCSGLSATCMNAFCTSIPNLQAECQTPPCGLTLLTPSHSKALAALGPHCSHQGSRGHLFKFVSQCVVPNQLYQTETSLHTNQINPCLPLRRDNYTSTDPKQSSSTKLHVHLLAQCGKDTES